MAVMFVLLAYMIAIAALVLPVGGISDAIGRYFLLFFYCGFYSGFSYFFWGFFVRIFVDFFY
jgi:hypothetical protein